MLMLRMYTALMDTMLFSAYRKMERDRLKGCGFGLTLRLQVSFGANVVLCRPTGFSSLSDWPKPFKARKTV